MYEDPYLMIALDLRASPRHYYVYSLDMRFPERKRTRTSEIIRCVGDRRLTSQNLRLKCSVARVSNKQKKKKNNVRTSAVTLSTSSSCAEHDFGELVG